MLPFIIIGIVLVLSCCSMCLPSCISSSVLFGDLRSSKAFQKAKEHFDTNKQMKPAIINQRY